MADLLRRDAADARHVVDRRPEIELVRAMGVSACGWATATAFESNARGCYRRQMPPMTLLPRWANHRQTGESSGSICIAKDRGWRSTARKLPTRCGFLLNRGDAIAGIRGSSPYGGVHRLSSAASARRASPFLEIPAVARRQASTDDA
jgi:hypothetical protein